MKRMKLMMILILSLLWLKSINAAYEKVSLNGDWDFTFKPGLSVDVPDLPEPASYDIKLRVPDYMNFQTDRLSKAKWWKGSKDYAFVGLRGTAFYRKVVDVPKNWNGKAVKLQIGRVYERANVWINGKHLGFFPYACFTPVQLDLSEALKPGEQNEIIISVDNKKEMENRYFRYGGIVEPVSLNISNGSGIIDDLYIRPGKDLNEFTWQVDLKVPFKEKSFSNSKIDWIIKEYLSGKKIACGTEQVKPFKGNTNLKWTSKTDKIKPWHPNSPNLYIAELTWKNDAGKVLDILTQRFGLRRWSTEGRTLKLNGKPIYLRLVFGYPEHFHYRYPQDKNYWLKYYRLIKDFGYNAVGSGGTVLSPENLEAADEVGIVVKNGYIYGGGNSRKNMTATLKSDSDTDSGRLNIKELCATWTNIAKGTRNHPCMSIYYPFSEENYYEGMIDDMRKINDTIKSVNPESMFVPNQAMRGVEYCFLKGDKLTDKPFRHHAERLKKISEFADIFGQYPRGVFSYNPLKIPWHEVNQWFTVYKHPLISHEAVQGQALGPPIPEDLKFNSIRYGKKGMEYLCNVWGYPASKEKLKIRVANQKKDKKYLTRYKNSCKLNSIISKYAFEKMRKCDNISGYQDNVARFRYQIFNEPRPGDNKNDVLKYTNDNVLLLDFDDGNCLKRCYWEGDDFRGKIMVSLYGGTSLQDGTIHLEVKDGDNVLYQDTFKSTKVPNGKVTTIADFAFKWPDVVKNSKLSLTLKLTASDIKLTNDWDFWVFKHPAPIKLKAACAKGPYQMLINQYPDISHLKKNSPEKLWITELLTNNELEHLEKGGDVLVLGGKPFPLYSRWTNFSQGYRRWHHHGIIVNAHPVFTNIPHEGWGDWQFYPLIEGEPSIIFNDLQDVPFNPIVEMIIRGPDRKETMMFEFRTGKGRVFVTTFKFDLSDPACITLMNSILSYLKSPAFKPETVIDLKTLKMLSGASSPVVADNEIRISPRILRGGKLFVNYSSFGITPRDGLVINPKQTTKIVFELKKSQTPIASGKNLVLSVDGQDSDKSGTAELEILLNKHRLFRGVNKCVEKGWSIWNIPFNKTWLKTGLNTLEIKNVKADNNWFMIAGITINNKIPAICGVNAQMRSIINWSSKPVTINFKEKKWCKVNHGKWQNMKNVMIKNEGVNQVYYKTKIQDKKQELKTVGIDLTPPVLKLLSKPIIEQEGGEYFGTQDTVFEISAEDKLSGIKEIKISLDSGEYKPYKGAFKLPKGKHSIKSQCVDAAGNRQSIFTGGLSGGSTTNCIQIQIK